MNYSKLIRDYTLNHKFHCFLYLVIAAILSYITISTYYPASYLTGHDSIFHLNRFQSIYNAIENGNYFFYINTESLNGYGYADNLFYPDVFLYPFALFIGKLGLIPAFKLLLGTSFFLCAVISFFSLKKVFKNIQIATIGSLLYTFSVYRFIDMAERGALGEFLAFSFIPLFFWGAYEILFGNYKKRWYIISIACSCLLLCHLISSLMVFICLCIFLLIYYKQLVNEPKRFYYFVLSGCFTILLSLFFLAPMLEQMLSNKFYYEAYPFSESLSRLFPVRLIIWGMFTGLIDSYQRIPSIGILVVFPLFARLFISKRDKAIRFADISTIVGFILLFSATEIFPWHVFPFNKLTIIQFPFRFIMISTFLFSCSIGVYLYKLLPNTKSFYLLAVLIVALTYLSIKSTGGVFQGVGYTTIHNKSQLDTYEIGVGCEYLPANVPSVNYLKERGNNTISSDDSTNVFQNIERKNAVFSFDITNINKINNITLPLVYYKGYKAIAGNENIEITESQDGLVQIQTDRATHIKVWYSGTFIQSSSLIISALSILALCTYIFYFNRKKLRFKPQK